MTTYLTPSGECACEKPFPYPLKDFDAFKCIEVEARDKFHAAGIRDALFGEESLDKTEKGMILMKAILKCMEGSEQTAEKVASETHRIV